jgi:cobalt/nickel transport system permease protein
MHIPDGFLSLPVWAGLASVSGASVVATARRAQAGLEESRLPMLGVMGAFVFAAQMINFPVGLGASGHLVGSALLTAVLGTAPAIVVMTAILLIQALVFQDGGLLALGANVFNMALCGVLVASLSLRAFRRWPGFALFAAGFLSLFAGAMLCLGELALSGASIPSTALTLALTVFTITGVLEGLITATVAGALGRMNPNWLTRDADARPAIAALSLAAILLASVGFLAASALPDGLERFAEITGLAGREVAHVTAPLPDYELLTASNPWIRKAGAGLLGLALTWATCLLLGRWIARFRSA